MTMKVVWERKKLSVDETSLTVCAVVVTYNRQNLLKECLEGIQNQSRCPDELIVVDNASTDGTANMVRKLFPWASLIELPYNTGGAGGFSEGYRVALTKKSNWLWLMDDDVIPEHRCLENLLKGIKLTSDCVAIVPARVWKDDNMLIAPEAMKFDMRNPFYLDPNRRLMDVETQLKTMGELPNSLDIVDLSFEGPLIRTDIAEIIGAPREELFIFYDDTDYAFRLRSHGRIIYLPSAVLMRNGQRRAQSPRAWREYYFLRNTLIMDRWHGQNWGVRYLRPLLTAGFVGSKQIIKLGIGHSSFQESLLIWMALVDGLLGRTGKRVHPATK